MGGQVWGGGVIVLVAVALWLVYLLPSWHSRHQYDAATRNAVRLNQALRVLAETSETPDEVRLELTARTALAQQKLARKAQAERDGLARRAQAEQEDLATQTLVEQQRTEHAMRQVRLEQARAQRAAVQRLPEVRRTRARRRARLTVTIVGALGLIVAGLGVLPLLATGVQTLVWAGSAVAVGCALLLVRMARVRARAEAAPVVVRTFAAGRTALPVHDFAVGDERGWQPRELPRPLASSAGSRAAAVLDAAAARERLRQATLDEPLRERAEAERPPQLEQARVARMGHIDDAEIEAHVREMLRQRAAG
ncbi:hypothetical protein GCM10022240_19780 [Microbacterium kribbense]|uniref:Large exoprotein n=1 Tax=Microbacterium kribbense TaxID=433645 RepID=A0ABP7GQG9_9MICO